ncbi:ParB-like nuclease [Escherichia coli]|nr:ParB-like nuclease [Escherichia coli]
MWTAWRSMPPCWKTPGCRRTPSGSRRLGNGAPDVMEPVGFCREDAGTYRSLPEPEAVLTEAEEERLNELMARYDALENQCEESDLLEAEMKLIDCMAKVRAWTPEMRAGSGVVVSWRYGNVCVQRGVQLRSEDDAMMTLTARNRCRRKRQWRKSVCHC